MSASDLPSWMWGDPAQVAERRELAELGCRVCQANVVTLMRGCCGDPRNERQWGWPYIGSRCKWFDELKAKGVGQ